MGNQHLLRKRERLGEMCLSAPGKMSFFPAVSAPRVPSARTGSADATRAPACAKLSRTQRRGDRAGRYPPERSFSGGCGINSPAEVPAAPGAPSFHPMAVPVIARALLNEEQRGLDDHRRIIMDTISSARDYSSPPTLMAGSVVGLLTGLSSRSLFHHCGTGGDRSSASSVSVSRWKSMRRRTFTW